MNKGYTEKLEKIKKEILSHKYDEGNGFDEFPDGFITGIYLAVKIIDKYLEEEW